MKSLIFTLFLLLSAPVALMAQSPGDTQGPGWNDPSHSDDPNNDGGGTGSLGQGGGQGGGIYPNPSNGNVNLEPEDPKVPIGILLIINSDGKKEQLPTDPSQPGPVEMDLGHLPAGVYTIRYEQQGHFYHERVQITH